MPPPVLAQARVVRIYTHGGPEVLTFETLGIAHPSPGEIVIAVKAIGLNRSEIMFRAGRHIETARFPARLGYEASGVIEAIGKGVAGFREGDPVDLVPPPSVTRWGSYGEIITVPASAVVPHPPGLTWVEGAAVWMANITAFGALIDIAEVRECDTILILAASSSVGIAAIQIARMIGAKSIATTRKRAKRQALLDAGANHVIVTEDEDLATRVEDITSRSGVRVVLDPVGGSGLGVLADTMAPQGILIAYGLLDGGITPMPIFTMIAKGLTMRGYTFKEVVLDQARRKRAIAFIRDGLTTRRLSPIIDRLFSFTELADAHRYMASNGQFGKVVAVIGGVGIEDRPALVD